jgi:hypothetical protein
MKARESDSEVGGAHKLRKQLKYLASLRMIKKNNGTSSTFLSGNRSKSTCR